MTKRLSLLDELCGHPWPHDSSFVTATMSEPVAAIARYRRSWECMLRFRFCEGDLALTG